MVINFLLSLLRPQFCFSLFSIAFYFRNIYSYFFFLYTFFPEAKALRDVEVIVPTAVRRGEHARLHCFYDLEGDSLYAVKWYKGRREFYRYTPKENPAMKTFTVNGINVLVSMKYSVKLVRAEPKYGHK